MNRIRPLPAVLALLAGALPLFGEPSRSAAGANERPAASATKAADGRVVVLGFDGADARTIRELMAERPGEFPTFERLAESGTFAPLEVVAPPESPVSWAALNTGQNPAKTGVPGFVRRNIIPGLGPSPTLGHMEFDSATIDEFDGAPSGGASPAVKTGAVGGGAFLVAFLLACVVLRGKTRMVVAPLLGIVAGSGAAWVAYRPAGELPEKVPYVRNPNQATNVWDYAASAGVDSIVLDAAQAWDMPTPEGATGNARVLAGLGLPDARAGIGEWFIYTTDPAEFERDGDGRKTSTAGRVYRVDEYEGVIQASIWGPKNFVHQDEIKRIEKEMEDPAVPYERSIELSSRLDELERDERPAVDMTVALEDGAARVTIDGMEQRVALGEWSPEFFELEFALSPEIRVHAITRVRLISLEPHFELFVNVLDIDPRRPPFWQPISTPAGFSAELADACGLYETYGWPTATMPVKDKEVDPELLMEDVEFTMKWREKLTQHVLGRDDWRFFMSVFSTTDRVQHMMYRFYDTEHPVHDAEAAAREMTFFGETIRLGEAVPAIYRQMDRVVGDVLDRLAPEDTLLICSDHGFQSFRRQVNINNWLVEQGYMTLKPGMTKKTSDFLLFVDWAKTRVYSMGFGFLYLNLEGREPNGIVPPSEADALMAEVRSKFLESVDPETGAKVCKEVYITKEVHSGDYLDRECDMLLGFGAPYRVSWATTMGGLHAVKNDAGVYEPGPVYTDNESPWSGGHISMALPDVAGVFFCNKRVDIPESGVHALQIAPTVLDLLGVAVPSEMDREPLSLP